MPRRFVLPLFIFSSLLLVLSVYWWGYQAPVIGVDDANIYFVYMRNLADGHGFVWNVGGERVEGFTSLIWTLFGGLAYRVTPAYFNFVLLFVNFGLMFLALRSVLRFSRMLNKTEGQSLSAIEVIILALLLLPLGFVEWNILALMETGLWTFLIVHLSLQLVYRVIRPDRFSLTKFLIMIALLDLTRPESLVLSFLFIGLLFIISRDARGDSAAWKAIALPIGVHLATVASLLLWRLSYFGYPFPNTYYAKVSGAFLDNIYSGIRYLFLFFYSYPHAAMIVALLVLFAIMLFKRFRADASSVGREEKAYAVLLVVIFAGLALPVLTGGDHFKYSRFYQSYLPLMYLVGTSVFLWREYLGASINPRGLSAAVLALPVVFGSLFLAKYTVLDFFKARGSVNYNILNDFNLAQNARRLADRLNETFSDLEDYPSLGALATGSIGYSYNGKTIDLLGLNNTTMAHANPIKQGYRNHASFDKGGFWELSPDIVGAFMGADVVADTALFVLPENTRRYRTSDITYLCYKGIFDDADFRDAYKPALVRNKSTDYFIFGYYKKTFLLDLMANGKFFVRVMERKPVPPRPGEQQQVARGIVKAADRR